MLQAQAVNILTSLPCREASNALEALLGRTSYHDLVRTRDLCQTSSTWSAPGVSCEPQLGSVATTSQIASHVRRPEVVPVVMRRNSESALSTPQLLLSKLLLS